METTENINISDIFLKAMKEMGKVNILITGKTGVGKSTLLNSVFGEDLAETGIGRPVTQTTREYSREGAFYHLFDTKGFEMENYEEILSDVIQLIRTKKTNMPAEHIHVIWYCINYNSNRIEDSEEEFIKTLSREIPVIVVLTQVHSTNKDFKEDLESKFHDTDIRVIDLLAQPYQVDETYTKQAYNVKLLVDVTSEMLPEIAKMAFAAAQRVNKEIVRKAVKQIIAVAATAAGGIGAAPIPFSDALALAPVQIAMLAKISSTMGLDMTTGFLTTLVSSAAGVIGASFAGRAIVSGLLKCIPGVGSIAGGTISAATASALTVAMGWAYYKAVDKLHAENAALTPDAVAAAFVQSLKEQKLEAPEE